MNTCPQFAQIFLYDPDDAIQQLSIRPGGYVLPSVIDIVLLRLLLEMLHEYNPFVTIYRTAYERMQQALSQLSQNNIQIILNPQMELLITKGLDQHYYNLAMTNEVAIIIPDEYREASHRDIILAQRNNTIEGSIFRTITSSHAAYTLLHYVLLFPFGEPGWNWSLRLQHSQARDGSPKRLSQRQYYQFHLHS